MNNFATPIIILGGGLAGLYCALKLAPLPVTLIAPNPVGTSGASYWAQGGIAAAVEEGDTPEKHAFDTIAAGAGLVDADIALGMAQEARKRIDELLELGAPFDRTKQGQFLPSQEAAHSHRRIIRVKGDSAGRAIMETLKNRLNATPSITVIENATAYKIIKNSPRNISVYCSTSEGTTIEYHCKCLVLATGGVGHLYRLTTNPFDSCGAGVAMAAQAGAIIADTEFVQFHPTAIDMNADPAPLATESLRGEGATIINRFGHRLDNPGLTVIAHPECPKEVVKVSDFSGSTAAMIDYVKKQKPKSVLLVTECSMADNVAAETEGTEFVRPCNLCPHMKRITLPKILDSLLYVRDEIFIDPIIAEKARRSVQRMIDLG